MSSNRFTLSIDFTRQYLFAWYTRRPLIDKCIDRLENGNATVMNCPDEDRTYTEYNKCRVYFRNEIFLGIVFV